MNSTLSIQKRRAMMLVFGGAAIAAATALATGCGGSDLTDTTAAANEDAGGNSTTKDPSTTSSDAGSSVNDAGSSKPSSDAGAPTCGANAAMCGGTCIDVQSDNANCGACGNVCGQGLACSNGKCPVLTVTGGSYSLIDSSADAGVSSSGAGASFTLLNERAAPINLEWVDYSGVEQNYGDIAPGGKLGMGTYVTHVWRVHDQAADGGVLGTFVLNDPNAYTVTAH